MRSILKLILSLLLLTGLRPASAEAQGVVVNGEQLPDSAVIALQLAYRTIIPSGRYWYDAVSGLWGREGQPFAGQMQPGLQLGGELKANASDGDTDVYVNGRRLPRAELYSLQQLVGPVRPGRYWLDPYGNAGFEGGPALVNLAQARARSQGGGYAGWNNNTPFGNWGGDSNCTYYNSPNDSVMVGDGC